MSALGYASLLAGLAKDLQPRWSRGGLHLPLPDTEGSVPWTLVFCLLPSSSLTLIWRTVKGPLQLVGSLKGGRKQKD